MSLVVETGEGLATADSYISVADATTRHTNLGNTNWALLSNDEMEQALRRATIHMTNSYRSRWQGYRRTVGQALDWPRVDVVVDQINAIDSDTVPSDIQNACADFALKAAAGDLNADLERGIVREKVGPIETEFDRNTPQSVRYRAIDMALAPYLKGSSAMASLVRS